MTNEQKPPFQPGEEFTMKGQRYEVNKCLLEDRHGDGFEWYVDAYRFIKTTQTFSGTPRRYSLKWLTGQF